MSLLFGLGACEADRISDGSAVTIPPAISNSAVAGIPATQMVSVFIHFDDEPPAVFRRSLETAGGTQVRRAMGPQKMIMGQFPAGAMEALRRIPWATEVNGYPNTLRPATETTSWGFNYVRAGSAHSLGYTGETGGVRGPVAILDNGVYEDHYELDANINECWDYVGGNSSSNCYPGSHGTPVAGVLAAEMNGAGIRGIAYTVGFDAIRVCDSLCPWTDIHDGLSRVSAYTNYYDVVNLSLGDCGGEDLPPLKLSISFRTCGKTTMSPSSQLGVMVITARRVVMRTIP